MKIARTERMAMFSSDEFPTISFLVNGIRFNGQAKKIWKSVVKKDEVTFESISSFPLSLVREMQQAKTISISDNFPKATADLSLNSNLSIRGLNSGSTLLSRAR